jgi:hypothetical protein
MKILNLTILNATQTLLLATFYYQDVSGVPNKSSLLSSIWYVLKGDFTQALNFAQAPQKSLLRW